MSRHVALTVPGDDAAGPTAVLLELAVSPGEEVASGAVVARLALDKADVELTAPVTARVEDTARHGALLPPGATVVLLRPVSQGAASAPGSDLAPGPSEDAGAPAVSPPPPAEGVRVEPLSRVRRTIARTMMTSLATTAQLTSVASVDVTHLMQLRARWNPRLVEQFGVKVSPFHLLARAVCLTLPRHPMMNSWVDERTERATFHDYVDLGVAVDTPTGLVVVTVPRAERQDVTGVARAVQDLAARARAGQLRPTDVRRGTFTLSNTGSNGTTFGTPILNPPQVGLLATYAIERRPVVRTAPDGTDAIAVRSMMNLALTYDHRVVDGADAGRFLQDLRWVVAEHDFGAELATACS